MEILPKTFHVYTVNVPSVVVIEVIGIFYTVIFPHFLPCVQRKRERYLLLVRVL